MTKRRIKTYQYGITSRNSDGTPKRIFLTIPFIGSFEMLTECFDKIKDRLLTETWNKESIKLETNAMTEAPKNINHISWGNLTNNH
jgi:hypothetical protein